MKNFSLQEFLADLKTMCAMDSGHHNAAGTTAMAEFLAEKFRSLGLHTEIRWHEDNDYAPFLMASNSDDEAIDVMFVAHMDTVFPVGTAADIAKMIGDFMPIWTPSSR